MFNALSNVVGYLNAEGYCNANRCHVSSPLPLAHKPFQDEACLLCASLFTAPTDSATPGVTGRGCQRRACA